MHSCPPDGPSEKKTTIHENIKHLNKQQIYDQSLKKNNDSIIRGHMSTILCVLHRHNLLERYYKLNYKLTTSMTKKIVTS